MIRNLFIFSLCLFLAAGSANAQESASFSDAQKTEIQKILKDYLAQNPEIVIEALQAFQQKQEEGMRAAAEDAIQKNKEALFGKDLPSAGNPQGDVTVVEFFDYNCGYCKQALKDLEKIMKEDPNVRFVFKELPVLGPTSEIAARWSLASHKQGKFFEFHTALMKNMGGINEASLEKIANDTGLNVEQLKKDAGSDEIKQAVRDSRDLAIELQIQGTPGFVIGDKFYRGYIGEEGMKNAIADARATQGKEG